MKSQRIQLCQFILLSILFSSCVYEQITPVIPPCPGKEVSELTAEYAQSPPTSLNDPFWFCADYITVDVQNSVTGQVNETDGILNTSGTFNGLADFNEGNDPELTIKAAYDNENIYILASWSDNTYNPEQRSWVYNGKSDLNKPQENPAGWTSQRSDDKIEFSFKIDNTKNDIWKWSLSLSEPLGYAIDMFDDGSLVTDAGDVLFMPNMAGSDNRSGPKYEWSGVQQELTRDPGGFTILDPGFFLMEKTDFAGDMAAGDVVYQAECAGCHGANGSGSGDFGDGSSFLVPGKYNRISRNAFPDIIDVGTHDGRAYWTAMNEQEKTNVIARIRGFTGVPGFYLENPQGTAPDVKASSNVVLARIPDGDNQLGYQVLLIRKLDTSKSDDLKFDPSTGEYSFKVFLYDNDEINKVGSADYITLKFK